MQRKLLNSSIFLFIMFMIIGCAMVGEDAVGVLGGTSGKQYYGSFTAFRILGNEGNGNTISGEWMEELALTNRKIVRTFSPEGTFWLKVFSSDNGQLQESLGGRYQTFSDRLIINFIDGVEVTYQYSVNGNVLKAIREDQSEENFTH